MTRWLCDRIVDAGELLSLALNCPSPWMLGWTFVLALVLGLAIGHGQTVDPGPSVTVGPGGKSIIVCAECSTGPHRVRIGATVYSYIAPITAPLPAGTPPSIAMIYISDGSDNNPPGTVVVANINAVGFTCAGATCIATFGSLQPFGIALAEVNPYKSTGQVTDLRTALSIH